MSSNVARDVAIMVNQQLKKNRIQVFPRGSRENHEEGEENTMITRYSLACLASYDLMVLTVTECATSGVSLH